MGIRDLLERWTTLPEPTPAGYRCGNCGADLEAEAEACPDCGGPVEVAVPEHVEIYWPHH